MATLDIDQFLQSVKTAISSLPALSGLGGRMFLDQAPGRTKPWLRVTQLENLSQRFYTGRLNEIPVQFSVFADAPKVATDMAKAVADQLESNGLGMTGFISAHVSRGSLVKAEQDENGKTVYHGYVQVWLRVES